MNYYNHDMKWFMDTGGMSLQNPVRHVLHRVFWSFAQTEHAFQFCRPVVLVDGTFLTEKYRGTLMMAATVDLEDQIVPMAFALAEREQFIVVMVIGPDGTEGKVVTSIQRGWI
jgi:hypothetical protein